MKVQGWVTPPGDKSITHRALLLGALAVGRTVVHRPLTALDARSMAGALRMLGVSISDLASDHPTVVHGGGLQGLTRPAAIIDCGNAGTVARLLAGALAASRFDTELDGDASLRRRPMRRVTEPLRMMGARFIEKNGDALPLVVCGGPLEALDYTSPVASAQVKTALLLAGLVAGVPVSVTEPGRSRDHTERMLVALGITVETRGNRVGIAPADSIPGFEITVPGDPSSAAFLVAAGLLAREGEVTIRHVGLNPTRCGYVDVLRRMGARIDVHRMDEGLGEPVGDLVVRPSHLEGTRVTPDEVPGLIDEIPILAVLASLAEGETIFEGVGELRVKESDRLELMARNLRAVGGEAEACSDSLHVVGRPGPRSGIVDTGGDHRIAMAFAVQSRARGDAIQLSESESPAVSYPGFFHDLAGLFP